MRHGEGGADEEADAKHAGTRFRPLSLKVPKPLFPIAGKPMLHHPLAACAKLPGLQEIFVLGFFEEKEFALYLASVSAELNVRVQYLKETSEAGSAGGLYEYRNVILEEKPEHLFVIHCDVCCTFPLGDLLEAHRRHNGALGTVLGKTVNAESAAQCGQLAVEPNTMELLHYTEKPETLVSRTVNTGVYVFNAQRLFDQIGAVIQGRGKMPKLRRTSSFSEENMATAYDFRARRSDTSNNFARLDQDVMSALAGKKLLYVHRTEDFWEQIKTPGITLRCSELYLSMLPQSMLAKTRDEGPTIRGLVYIHPSAKVHPSAVLGPSVSVGPNVRVCSGARLINCIVLDDCKVDENACIINSIIGWQSEVGRWARVQANGNYDARLGVTILGEDVVVKDEVVVTGCVVLPHKSIGTSVMEEILL